jgi:hypothetical protein
MKNKKSKTPSIALAIIIVLMLTSNVSFGQAPPPPGVPLDFGLSGLVALCVGYGAYRNKNND